MCIHWLDLPLYALQRSAPDRWLVWTPDDAPVGPAVRTVAALGTEDYAGCVMYCHRAALRAHATKVRAEIANFDWHSNLLKVARLQDRRNQATLTLILANYRVYLGLGLGHFVEDKSSLGDRLDITSLDFFFIEQLPQLDEARH